MSSSAFADQVEYFYDDAGRLQWVQKGADIRYYQYDEVGNLLSIISAQAIAPVVRSIDPDIFIIGNSYSVTISGQNLLTAARVTSDNSFVTARILKATDTAIIAAVTVYSNASPGQVILTVKTPYGSAGSPVNLYSAVVFPDTVTLLPGGSVSYSVTLSPAAVKNATSAIANKTPAIIGTPSSVLIPAGGAGHFIVNALAAGTGLLSVGSAASTVTVDGSGGTSVSVTLPVSVYVDSRGEGTGVSFPVSVMIDASWANGAAVSSSVSVITDAPSTNGIAVSSPVSVILYPAAATPASYDFGLVTVGATSPAQIFTVTNAGTDNTQVGTVAITGNNSSEFTVINNTCAGKTLAAGQSCTFQVVFSPATGGNKAAGVSVLFSSPISLALNVTLAGSGVFPNISVSPASYDFGSVNVGTTAQQTFTISNTAAGNLNIGSLALTGTNAAEFQIAAPNGCSGQSIAPAGNCAVQIIFAPAISGPKVATLSIPSNDPSNNPLNVPLSGSGINYQLTVTKSGPGNGAVTSSPAGIDCGTSCSAFYNPGVTVTLTATPDARSTFFAWSGACSGSGTCTVTMDAAKSVTATFTITYTITATAGANGSITPSGKVPVAMGTSQSFSMAPAPGYWISDVIVDGVSIGGRTTYTFSNVQSDHTIRVVFGPTIVATAGPNGRVLPSGTSYLISGASQTYTIKPNKGYRISNVLVDGVSVHAVRKYKFRNVTTPHTISAIFGKMKQDDKDENKDEKEDIDEED